MTEQSEALRLADYWKRRAAELQVWIDDGEGVEFGFRHEGLLKEQAKFLETADSFTALEAEAASLRDQNTELDRRLAEMEQAGRQALKALAWCFRNTVYADPDGTITALRQALGDKQ